MTGSTTNLVVLRQTRGKRPGLVVPSAIRGSFRRITEGVSRSRQVNMCFLALQAVEDSMTLDKFLEHHDHPIRQQDIHPTNIIDLDVGPHKKTMKHTFSFPNLVEEYSVGHIYISRITQSEKNFPHCWHQWLPVDDWTGRTERMASGFHQNVWFLLFVEGKERICCRRANRESPTAFWWMARRESSVNSFQPILKSVIFFRIAKL